MLIFHVQMLLILFNARVKESRALANDRSIVLENHSDPSPCTFFGRVVGVDLLIYHRLLKCVD